MQLFIYAVMQVRMPMVAPSPCLQLFHVLLGKAVPPQRASKFLTSGRRISLQLSDLSIMGLLRKYLLDCTKVKICDMVTSCLSCYVV